MTSSPEYRVHISEKAKQMLDTHAVFLAQISEEASERLVASFVNAANSLKTMPQRCPWLIGAHVPPNLYRYLLFEKRYAIIFQTKNNVVYIDYVVDCRQDCGWLFQS